MRSPPARAWNASGGRLRPLEAKIECGHCDRLARGAACLGDDGSVRGRHAQGPVQRGLQQRAEAGGGRSEQQQRERAGKGNRKRGAGLSWAGYQRPYARKW